MASMLAEGQAIIALHNVYAATHAISQRAGDISLLEHAFLLCAQEFPSGLSLKRVKASRSYVDDPVRYIELLEDRELVSRVRDGIDRRGFSLVTTLKGRSRLQLIDQSIAAGLVGSFSKLSEETLEHLVARIHAFSASYDPERQLSTFFPSIVWEMLSAYHQAVAYESMRIGLTSLQAALLCAADDAKDFPSSPMLAQRLDVSEDILEIQTAHLRTRQLLWGDDSFELTDEGRIRIDMLSQRLNQRFDKLVVEFSEEQISLVEELCGHCTYLFI